MIKNYKLCAGVFFSLWFLGTLTADDHLFGSVAREGMTFHCPFDSKADAAVSAGSKTGRLIDKKGKCFVPGISNASFLAGRKGQFASGIDFEAEKNFSPEEGTVMFWIKAEDWKVTDKTFNLFFSLRSPDNRYGLVIYRPGANVLQFLFNDIKAKKNNYVSFRLKMDFIRNWHHIAAVWNKKEMFLYVDGLPAGKQKRTFLWPKEKNARVFRIGYRGWKVESGLTRIDDFRIFNRPLDAAGIREEYRALGSAALTEKTLLLTVGRKTPEIDGKIQTGEYVATGTGFCVKGGRLALQQSFFHLAHDGKYLYFALKSPQKTPPRAGARTHDGNCWEDDSAELWLELPNKHWYQFIFNTRNVIYDSRSHGRTDPQWNCNGVKVAGGIRNGFWELEAAIPLSQLENFKKARINIARTFKNNIGECTEIIHSKGGGYGDRRNFIPLELTDSSVFYAVHAVGDLGKGKVDVDMLSSLPAEICYKTRSMTLLREKAVPVKGRIRLRGNYEQDGSGILTIDIPGVYTGIFRSGEHSPVRLNYIYTDIKTRTLQNVLRNESGVKGTLYLKLTERRRKNGKVFSKNIPVNGQQIVWTEGWDLSRIPSGDYDYTLVFKDQQGREGTPFVQWYRIPGKKNHWDDNKIGIYPGEVPPPWIPLKTCGKTVTALTQKYELGTSALPGKMGALKHNVLSRPAAFILNGQLLKFNDLKLTGSAPDRVTFAGTARCGAVSVDVKVTAEYDGMLWFDFFFFGENARINSLYALFPFKKEYASEVHGFDRGSYKSKYASGLVPEKGWCKNLYSKPAFWIGNEEAGLSWYAEDLRGWRFSDPSRTLEIKPGKKETLLRFNMIDKTVRLTGKRRISFGMHATPVKPVDREAAASRFNQEWGWSDGSLYYNYLDSGKEFFDSGRLRHHQRRYQRKLKEEKLDHSRFFLYIGSNGASPYCPEWGWFGKEWAGGKVGNYIIEYNIKDLAARNKWVWTYSCLNSKSFREFFLYQLSTILRDSRWNIQNLYYDLCGPRMCDNREHGCGYTDEEGRSWGTQNIRGGRDFHKRIYHFLHKTHPGTKQMYHLSGQPAVMAVHAFADGGNLGETWFENDFQAKGYSYIGIFAPDMFRTQCAGKKWGFQIFYTPQFYRANKQTGTGREKFYLAEDPLPEIKRAYRHFLGYILVHNISAFMSQADVWLNRMHTLYWTARREFFGNNYDLAFIPYWQKKRPFSYTANKRIMVSAYAKNGSCMLVIMNDTDKQQTVRIDLGGFKKKFRVAPNPEGTTGVIQAGILEGIVPARDFRVYFLRPEK